MKTEIEIPPNTVVVPASQGGFDKVFLGKKLWYPVKLHPKRHEAMKYVAIYRTAPISAITHYAEIAEISLIHDAFRPDLYVLKIKPDSISELPHQITRGQTVRQIQHLKLTSLDKLLAANTTDDL